MFIYRPKDERGRGSGGALPAEASHDSDSATSLSSLDSQDAEHLTTSDEDDDGAPSLAHTR